MKKVIAELLHKSAKSAGIVNPVINLEHPENIQHGDFSTNIAMVHAKELKISPKALAEKIVEECNKNLPEMLLPATVAGPGFINFKIADEFFSKKIIEISKDSESFGRSESEKGKQIMVEYTDPNPFKVFHIGHLMSNTIGESISRLIEFSGAKVIRTCYQGDVGLHVAKTIWAILEKDNFDPNVKYLGEMYTIGNEKYDNDEKSKKEIDEVNRKIFERSDKKINEIYDKGREISLEYFDTIYKKLGTKFDQFFFESEVFSDGVEIVKEFLKKGIFEESQGAVVFPGEKYNTHTRVFLTSSGLPTYETKELGLTKSKFKTYPKLDKSIVITANEQDAYFKVILAVLRQIYPVLASKTKHVSHGILRPSSGKMSSRKGNVVAAETLLNEFETLVEAKIKDRELSQEEKQEIKRSVAIAGLKYTILRQAIGGDIIYDPEKALSFEGDSGPYLQYSAVRANAVLSKAGRVGKIEIPKNTDFFEKLLIRFPEIVERSCLEYAPHHIVTYLIELASAFNAYYANNQIIDEKEPLSPYRVTLTKVFLEVMNNGLWMLGIQVPKRM